MAAAARRYLSTDASALVISRMLLQMRWREYLTRRLAGWWIADQRYYRLQFVAREQAAPEYRIAEDVRLAIEPLVEFAIGLISALVTAATFRCDSLACRWLRAIYTGGAVVEIPSYMALAASFTPSSPRSPHTSPAGRWSAGSLRRTRWKRSSGPR